MFSFGYTFSFSKEKGIGDIKGMMFADSSQKGKIKTFIL